MRIIKETVLKEFYTKHPTTEKQLRTWVSIMRKCNFETPNEVQEVYPSADQVGNKRMVFNICRNEFRLIAMFLYEKQRVYIRFIGSHAEYDNISDIKNI